MRPLHYHIVSCNEMGRIIASLEYDDPIESIVDYLDLSFAYYKATTDVKQSRLFMEKALLTRIEEGKDFEVVIGPGFALPLIWRMCECDFAATNN